MIGKKIIETLKPLEIPVVRLKYNGAANNYVMFQIFDEKDMDNVDNRDESTVYWIEISLWHDENNFHLRKEIKQRMIEAGFVFNKGHDMFEDKSIGKRMDFTFKEWNLF